MSGARARRLPTASRLQVEGVLLAGGLRALLLQLAHPAVGHGVARHSDFAADPLGRLTGTLQFVYVVASGEPRLVRRSARAVASAHRPVVSEADWSVHYDARDPALQFWVAATIHDTALRIAEAVWGPLPPALADELLVADGRIAIVLGLPAEEWPTTRAAFDAAFARACADLAFDVVTLPVVAALIDATAAPWWIRRALPLLARSTLGTLPPAIRPAMVPVLRPRLPDLLPLARRIAPAWRLLPRRLRRLPADRILAAARRAS